ncbi:MAG: 4-alpha-glucanotransferase [Pseudomonadota bacterium]
MTALKRLCDRLGVARRYHELDGTPRDPSEAALRAVLRALGVSVQTDGDAAEALAALEAEDAARTLPREDVLEAGRPGAWRGPGDRSWRLELEDGEALEGPPDAPLPPLPPGVHRLTAEDGEAVRLIAAPPSAPGVAETAGRARVWGATGAIYAMASSRGTGIGDFEDLARAAEGLGALGADFLGINPVHLLGVADQGLSPYSPSSRTGLDVRHVAPDRLPEFALSPEARTLRHGRRGRPDRLTDPKRHASVHPRLMRRLFQIFEQTGAANGRSAAFEGWRAAAGPVRERVATFDALSIAHGPDWRGWPEALRDATQAQADPKETRLHLWLQWCAESQLAEAQMRARLAGMSLGLYLDIAVGVRPGGAETWASPQAFARGVSLGAPPDMMNAQGQVWNLAPFNPLGLARTDYSAFRRMLRAAMARAGVVRIDHAMGLERAFWIPEGGEGGTYVRQPSAALLALVRIEAARAGAVVVGEDLGTVPEGFRERMAASGLSGCAVLQFDGGPAGFPAPAETRAEALAAFGTHDTPTLAGWWRGADLDLRVELGHMDDAAASEARARRAEARRALARRLVEEDLLPEGAKPEAPPETLTPTWRDAVHALIARSGAALAAVQIEDALGAEAPQNVPGTVDAHPNWRRLHAVPPEGFADDPDLRRAAAVFSAERRASASL